MTDNDGTNTHSINTTDGNINVNNLCDSSMTRSYFTLSSSSITDLIRTGSRWEKFLAWLFPRTYPLQWTLYYDGGSETK